ncbi:S8 family serine peptidase [Actinomadura bangladeshensis]|uniref:S8 family serine peptidase n=1 Tax=Actinomadura bangladeshensis TaxID=453573 RepID=UPI0014052311|nr:S8 family serine peptidase [Actinomadura bangladeshensis]
MLRRAQKLAGSILAASILGAVALPGTAAAAPRPLSQEWWFKTWGVQQYLWPLSTGKGVTVAVIDTGVEAGLPELRGAVLPGMDAEDGSGDGRQDQDSTEAGGHGTGMAMLIAAQGGGTGMVGVAPDAKILPVVAQSNPAYAKGIRFAADRGAKVINLSQAVPGPCPRDLQESIAYALGKDAVIVAGAGNDGNGANSSNSPANCKGVMSVGAVDLKFNPWEKTQRQPYVTVAAPGAHTWTVLKDGKLYSGSGTSAAAALVSGAVAIIRAKHPDMKNREVVRGLIASSLDIYDKGKDSRTGYGIIRPYRPLAGKVPKGTANPVFEEFDQWVKTHQPEGSESAAPAASKDDDSSSFAVFIVWGVTIVVVALLSVFAFFFSRRKRGGPPPMGPGAGYGAPPGFGQPPGPPPGGQGGPYPQRPPQGHPPQSGSPGGVPPQGGSAQGGPPQYQPHPPMPPGQRPPGEAPPTGPPQ